MFYYVVVDGIKMPTPYGSLQEADLAIEDYKRRLGPCCCEVIYE